MCHCEERSDVAIQFGINIDEIATSACGLLAMTALLI